MKIKLSLKLFFMLVMLLLGLLMAGFFSVLALNYYEQGLDRSTRQSMLEAAEVEGVKKGHPVKVLGYHIASSWQDLPPQIKEVFADTPPVGNRAFAKKLIGATFFSPPEKVYLVLKVNNQAGQPRYIAKVITRHQLPAKEKHIPHILHVAIFALASIACFLLVVIFMIRKVTKPVESLKNWAKSLNEEKLQQPLPDFQYTELNTLAAIVNASLSSVQQTLAREQQFLSHASHELRTPIAVIRTNSELLGRLQEKQGTAEKQSTVLARIERAAKTMTNLTETLLWLSRDDANLPASGQVNLAQIIEQLIGELDYLLKNKPVQLQVQTEPYNVNAPEIPCRIVLTNLIRNAFQHTAAGTVSIHQVKRIIIISNSNAGKTCDSTELGFGLGLQLSQKLAKRYGWLYSDKVARGAYRVQIRF